MTIEPLVPGVLGGLGPAATLDFFAKFIDHTNAATDQEHLRIIIDNNPAVPNRNDAVAGTGPSPGPALAEMARGLERAGVDFVVMVCNAAHAFQADITAAIAVPFVSIIAETVRATLLRAPSVKRVGLLAAAGCLDAKLYDSAFTGYGVEVLAPRGASRERFMKLLYQIKAGDVGPAQRREAREIAHELLAAGAEAIVAGCTEVPLVLTEAELDPSGAVALIDSTAALVDATIAYARRERPLPRTG